jgi:hypothetical protein
MEVHSEIKRIHPGNKKEIHSEIKRIHPGNKKKSMGEENGFWEFLLLFSL